MSLVLADTNVWSRFYRPDFADSDPVVVAFSKTLGGHAAATTGIVYLELLRGFTRPSTSDLISVQFNDIPFIEPTRTDYAHAADLSVICRRKGVQLETVDALIAQICISNGLTLLSSDTDFVHAARHIPLDVWAPQ